MFSAATWLIVFLAYRTAHSSAVMPTFYAGVVVAGGNRL
jgi:hypothetical protein